MKLRLALLSVIFAPIFCSGQIISHWIRAEPFSFSFFQVHGGLLDSNSNYYTNITDALLSIEYLRKMDSTGTILWQHQISPDSLIPDTQTIYDVMISLCPDQGILALIKSSYTNVLIKLDSSGVTVFKKAFSSRLGISAMQGSNHHVYYMEIDTNYTHFFILDSLGTLLKEDSLSDGGTYSGTCIEYFSGDVFAYYTNSNNEGVVYHYHNDILQDSLVYPVANYSGINFVTDLNGNRYFITPGGVLRKYNSAWNLLWTLTCGEIQSIQIDSAENVYILNSINSGNTLAVKKIDSSGNLLWTNSLNTPAGVSYYPNSMILDSKGAPVISGKKFDIPSNGSNDNDKAFVARFSTTGHLDGNFEHYSPGATNVYAVVQNINRNDQFFFVICDLDSFYYRCLNTYSHPNVIGAIYYDGNSNCQQDSIEAAVPGINVSLTPGPYYSQTTTYGKFYFEVPDGNYTLNYSVPVNWQQTCPSTPVSIIVSNGVMTGPDHFGLHQISGMNDLEIDFIHSAARANRDMQVIIHYQNLGSVVLNGTVQFGMDNMFSFVSAIPAVDSINSSSLSWNFSNLIPGESRLIQLVLHSHIVPGGTTYTNTACIFSPLGDINPLDNCQTETDTVIASFDPNEKHVYPQGTGPSGLISYTDSLLCYKIVFQNSGNDTAFYVQVIDTLPEPVDPLTFRLGATFPPASYELSGSGVLRFVFDPANIPDSTTDEVHSHGYITYFVKLRPNLPLGTEIRNKADIYFDYNPRITTDTTLNTMNHTVSVTSVPDQKDRFTIYPNPASMGVFIRSNITIGNDVLNVRLVSLSGQCSRLFTLQHSGMEIDMKDFPAGVYFLELESGNLREVKKLIIMNNSKN